MKNKHSSAWLMPDNKDKLLAQSSAVTSMNDDNRLGDADPVIQVLLLTAVPLTSSPCQQSPGRPHQVTSGLSLCSR
ncbi:hypothetical protein J6590_065037 [Homalodisca vitripennis]|nr:hypothetical protein J6590_065037 [Homalodisca vitripennis]